MRTLGLGHLGRVSLTRERETEVDMDGSRNMGQEDNKPGQTMHFCICCPEGEATD